MKGNIYIQSNSSISAQPCFEQNLLETELKVLKGNRLTCIEPDYSKLIDVKKIRRMSRIIRMSVAASITATEKAGLSSPDGVIVGTSLGCLDDTNSFLSKMVSYNEEMLSPTAFIHSTHNTIASQIALHFKCYGYNSTYVHKSISFESALTDAILLLNENALNNVLVGGADEIIDNSFLIMQRLNMIKKDDLDKSGIVAGEGATFFMLTNKYNNNCTARIIDVETTSFTSAEEIKALLNNTLNQQNENPPDLILSGKNGDINNDKMIDDILSSCCQDTSFYNYKELCGEYGTSSAFGLWLATEILKTGKNPFQSRSNSDNNQSVNKILIYNQQQGIHHSFIIVEKC